MKHVKITSGLVILVVAVWVISLMSGRSAETIKIGALYPLTGGLASYGEPARNVAQIAVDDINASGGINGRKLVLVVEDHKCDPKEAVLAFEKLSAARDVHVFTSVACTGTVLSILPQVETKNAVLLGTVTSGNKLTGVSPNFFRNWASDSQESKLLADEILRKGYSNVAVIHENTDYAKGLVLAMQEFLKVEKNVHVTIESFTSGTTDVRTQLAKLSSIKPDLMFVSVQTITSGEMVLSQMEQLKFLPKAMFVNDNILKAKSLVQNHAALLDGAIGGDFVFPITGELKTVLAKYKARFGTDCPQTNICAAMYDAIQLLAKALIAKGNSAMGVRDYLKTINYSGVSGVVNFDVRNDRSGAQYSLFEIKSGVARVRI